MPTGRTATDIASMKDHTCAIMDDDSLYCWGNGMYGQIGDGTSTNSNLVPTMVDLPAGETTKSVTVGNGHTCAISNTDTLYCWGWNSDSQLGDGSTTNSGTPIDVGATIIPGGTWAIAVEAGGYHTCVILFTETTFGGTTRRAAGGRIDDNRINWETYPLSMLGLRAPRCGDFDGDGIVNIPTHITRASLELRDIFARSCRHRDWLLLDRPDTSALIVGIRDAHSWRTLPLLLGATTGRLAMGLQRRHTRRRTYQ